MLIPPRNGLLVIFAEEFSKNNQGFSQKTDWGFEIQGHHDATGPRWAKVIARGEKADSEITLGLYVLIEELMWTPGMKHDGVSIWKTDSSKVMAVCDTNPL